jgi:hypothetical protein
MTDCELTNLRIENNLLAEELKKHREAIRRLAEQDATLSVCDGRVIVTMDATFTNEEREVLKTVLRRVREDYFAGRFADSVKIAAVIDGLLERTT